MFDKLIHQTLDIPYKLNFTRRKVRGSNASLVLIHGLGASEHMWSNLIQKLPAEIDIITIDLIGFGTSPRPEWDAYDLETQARAVRNTLFWAGANKRLIVCGHSLGSLIGIELAALYPNLVNQLILCSPPIYKRSANKLISNFHTKGLRRIYSEIINNKVAVGEILKKAAEYDLVYDDFKLGQDKVTGFFQSLQNSIIKQDSYSHLKDLQIPTQIIYGIFDPLLIDDNYKSAATKNHYINLSKVAAGHQILGFYEAKLVEIIAETINSSQS